MISIENKRHFTLTITFLAVVALIFPYLGFFIMLIFLSQFRLTSDQANVVAFFITMTLCLLALAYTRVDGSGDWSRYAISMENYKKSTIPWFTTTYEKFYPVWYGLLGILTTMDLSINVLTAFMVSAIYVGSIIIVSLVSSFDTPAAVRQGALLKIFLFHSPIVMFSGYKSAFSLVLCYLGWLLVQKRKRFLGVTLMLVGIGTHPIASVLVVVMILTMLLKFRPIYMICAFVFSVIIMIGINFISVAPLDGFIGNKVNSYVLGPWGKYRFHDLSEVVLFYIAATILLAATALVMNVKFRYFISQQTKYSQKIFNFSCWYLLLCIFFIPYRTFELRLTVSGFFILLPIFIYWFRYKALAFKPTSFKVSVSYLLWLIIIDPRLIDIGESSFSFADNIQFKIFYSPFFSF